MRTMLEKQARFVRLLTLMAALGFGVAACADAESREAPADETPMEAQAPATDSEMPEASEPAGDEVAPSAPAPEAAAEADAPSMTVRAGTSMTFTVDQEISTDSYAVGDRFLATLSQPVMSGGATLLQAGTPSQWVVTQSTTEDGQALLAVQIESVDVDGDWVPVTATVAEADLDTDDPDSGGETAAKIGVGTAAGAIIGQVLGKDTGSTLKGAGVGAAVGTAVALATRGGSARIPAGSALTVQLDEPLTVY